MSANLIEFWAAKSEKLHLPVKEKYFHLAKRLFSYLPNLEFHIIPNNHWLEVEHVNALAKEIGLKKLRTGGPRYYWLKSILPTYGLNQILSLGGFYFCRNFQSEKFRSNYFSGDKSVKRDSYIFVDSHPGTSREIPSYQFDAAQIRGLKIIWNTMEIDFLELGWLLFDAKELHLVSSSPLCLAIVLGIRVETQIHYVVDPTHQMYGDVSQLPWDVFDLKSRQMINQKTESISKSNCLTSRLLFSLVQNKDNL